MTVCYSNKFDIYPVLLKLLYLSMHRRILTYYFLGLNKHTASFYVLLICIPKCKIKYSKPSLTLNKLGRHVYAAARAQGGYAVL